MRFKVYLTQEDKPYFPFLEKLLPGQRLDVSFVAPDTVTEAVNSADAILTCSTALIKMLTGKGKCNHEDYFGSLWTRENFKKVEVPILCLPPLKRLVSTKPGSFLCKRYLSKILKKENWPAPVPFLWSLADDLPSYSAAYHALSLADCISVDIETSPGIIRGADGETDGQPSHIISCVGYTGIFFGADGNSFECKTFVLPVRELEALKWVRKINSLPAPKIFQNGKYDNFYFLRFGAPVRNWLFDTLDAHHCMFSELPKNLGYIAAFWIREVAFWKDEGQTGDRYDLYKYNAKDAWATALVFLYWLREAHPWVIKNYLIEFPLNFPCLAAELDGLSINQEALEKQKTEQNLRLTGSLSSLQKKLGLPTFNPSSPKQVLQLIHLLGSKDITSSKAAELEKVADRHPINRRLIDEITEYRESRKLISTYLEAELWGGKLLYTLNPAGTDTGRLASRESQLWCGAQVQNIPAYFKQAIQAEEGFFLGECDYKQSESFCTAYLSGDANLLAAVLSTKDFHSSNASRFFGLSYEDILAEDKASKQLPVKPFTIRDLSKRVNHGKTYNMGDAVLLATMGMKNVLRAKELLKLPHHWTPLQVCKFLGEAFDNEYPGIKKEFYASIIAAIQLSKMLVSCLGWTRLCFGTPWSSKPDLNGYVAHVPSNLSVGIVNEAFSDIFWNLHMRSAGDFRLKAQIHDSILFSYREGRIDLVHEAARLMTKTKKITDCKGVKRLMTIPVDVKAEHRTWGSLKSVARG